MDVLPSVWTYANTATTIDYYTWWSVPHVLSHTAIDNIYSLDGQQALGNYMRDELTTPPRQESKAAAFKVVASLYQGRIETTATPFFYAVFGLAETGDYLKDRQTFTLISLTGLLLSTIILGVLLRVPAYYMILLLAVFLSSFVPFSSELRVGNVNRLQLLPLALFLLFFSRAQQMRYALAAGLMLGLTAMCKPNIFMIFFFVLILASAQKAWRQAIQILTGVGLGVGLALTASIAYFNDGHIWSKWFTVITSRMDNYYPAATGNVSLIKIIYDHYRINTGLVLQVGLAVVLSLFIFYVKRWRRPAREAPVTDALLVYGFGCIYLIMASGLAWLHYYTLLWPLAIYLLRPRPTDGPPSDGRWAALAKVLALSAFFLLTTFPFAVSPRSDLSNALLANTAALVMLFILMWQCAQDYRPVTASPARSRGDR